MRAAGLEVAVEARADPMRSGDVLDEAEGAGSHHVPYREVGVLPQPRRAVDRVPGRGEGVHDGRIHLLHAEDDGAVIRRLDRGDLLEGGLAVRLHAGGRIPQPFVADAHILGRQGRAVVEAHIGVDTEGVGHQVRRDRPALRQVAHDVRVVARLVAQQRRVVRREAVHDREGAGLVQVVGRRLGAHGEGQDPAPLRRLAGLRQRGGADGKTRDAHQRSAARDPGGTMCHDVPPHLLVLVVVRVVVLVRQVRNFGSSQSRSESPNRLKAKTASEMARPGKMIIHGASW